jgi:glucose-1-phosphatase
MTILSENSDLSLPPKVVVFDLGKVLLHFDFSIAVAAFASKCSRPITEIAPWFMESRLLLDYETGLITTEEFYETIRSETGYTGSLADFDAAFGPIFTVIEPMVAFQKRLKAVGIPTYIFSNTNDMAIRHIREEYPFFNEFDGYVFSYEVKSMKPDVKIYEEVERVTGRSGSDIFYIDDRLENIEAAVPRGWRVAHHVDVNATLKLASEMGLPGMGDL